MVAIYSENFDFQVDLSTKNIRKIGCQQGYVFCPLVNFRNRLTLLSGLELVFGSWLTGAPVLTYKMCRELKIMQKMTKEVADKNPLISD